MYYSGSLRVYLTPRVSSNAECLELSVAAIRGGRSSGQRGGRVILFISWAEDCSRSDNIALQLGGKSYMVYSPGWGSQYLTIAFKYLSQSIKTLRLLWKDRPRVVFVMTPPVFACLPVWIYCFLTRARYVIDAHSGAFLDPRWSGLLFIHRFFSRRAAATLVTNEHLARLLESWKVPVVVVADVPIAFPERREVQRTAGCRMTFVSTFAVDEPMRDFFDAAAGAPDVSFYVTGNYRKCDPKVLRMKPENVHLTGFMSREDYVRLLLESDAILALTTLDHTMQRAAYEAVYLGKPVITSNFGFLRQEFPLGTVHVDITPESIRAGVREMQNNHERLEKEVQRLREHKLERWRAACEQLMTSIG